MKLRILLTASILAICALAACGGGGGGITPNPGPSATVKPTATPVYSSQIRFIGTLAGQTAIQADLRSVQGATSAPIPVMVLSPSVIGEDTSVYGGEAQAVVSPVPASSPSVTFTQTNPAAAIHATPSPGPSQTPQPLPSGVVGEVQINGTNVVQSQSAGVATANIGSPIDQSPTTQVYSYQSVNLFCLTGTFPDGLGTPYAHHFGWKWNPATNVWDADDDMTTADVYIDGPNIPGQSVCSTGSTNPSETQQTIHIPGGDVRFATDSCFCVLSASQWADTETSFTSSAAFTINPDGSTNAMVVGRTRSGAHTFKLYGVTANLFGVEVSGVSVDGF